MSLRQEIHKAEVAAKKWHNTLKSGRRIPQGLVHHYSRLPRYLALAYLLLIAYASLYPMTGWRDSGISPWTFLNASWPRWWTGFDIGTNILAYLPLGYLITLACNRHPKHLGAAFIGALSAALLSIGLELTQNWLPSRVPSNLDWVCNTLGGCIGAWLAYRNGSHALLTLTHLQKKLFHTDPATEFALILLALWLLTQLSPENLLFTTGDIRPWLGNTSGMLYTAPGFFAIETLLIACNTLAIGLFARTLLAVHTPSTPALLTLFLCALFIRGLASAILIGPQHAMNWLTPGAGLGLFSGALLLTISLHLPHPWRISIASLALLTATILVNLAPANPYSNIALSAWQQGHFLNFNGLTRWVTTLWPYCALPCLILRLRHPKPNHTTQSKPFSIAK